LEARHCLSYLVWRSYFHVPFATTNTARYHYRVSNSCYLAPKERCLILHVRDLDIFSKNFTCHKGYDEGSAPTTLDQCGDITTYHSNELDGGFFPDEHYNVTYFSGGIFLYGRTGTESVQVGDVTIDQKIALVFEGHWNFPGAGTFGLSFPSAGTYVWKGLDPSKDDAAGLLPYSTWLFTAISQKKFLPVFSHAFEPQGTSSSSYGTLAFGGLPDVQHSGEWASAPIQKFKPYDTRHAIPTQEHLKNVPYPEYFHYKINLDGWTINGAPVSNLPSSGAGADYAVDTSTVNVWVPEALYNATAAAYTPPGVWTGDDWKIDCDAKAPDLALVIGGVSFPVNKGNMIYHSDEGQWFFAQ
jgi:hypothetical protein